MSSPLDSSPTDIPRPNARPLEYRADIYSLEELQQQRRDKIKRYAELGAQFRGGQNATSETRRKEHRALIATSIAHEVRAEWEKNTPDDVKAKKPYSEPAENWLERMARADARHIKFCRDIEKEYVEYILLENDINEINEKIATRKEELRAYTAELYLQGGG